MRNYLFSCAVVCTFAIWLGACSGSVFYEEAYQSKICVNDSPCYDYSLAQFGAVEKYPTKGYLHVAKPLNACMAVQENPCGDIDYPCFLLVVEGKCSYGYKAFVAANAGFQFVIIYNNKDDNLKKMENNKYGKLVRGDIMAVFVGKTAGLDLKRNNYTTGSKITITPPPLFPNLEYYLIPFVIIVGICFIVMAMFMVTRYYKNYLEKRRNRITPANLKKIPTRKFKKGDDYYDVCAICLDEYKDGDKLRILPCDHVYHCKCVDPWLTEGKKTCPVCKRPVEGGNNATSTSARSRRQEPSDSDADENTPLIQPSSSSSTTGRSIEV